MSPREQAEAIALLRRWLQMAQQTARADRGYTGELPPLLERLRLLDQTNEFLHHTELSEIRS